MSEHVTGLVKALVFGLMILGVIGIVGDTHNLTGYDLLGVGILAYCFIFIEIPKE
jgi:hypothetical protein